MSHHGIMPGRSRYPRRARKFRRGLRRIRKVIRRAQYQSQVFTETFKANTVALPGPTIPGVMADGSIRIQPGTQFTVGKFQFRMSDIPQVQN